jgi:P pilus assembly chaperone PapD
MALNLNELLLDRVRSLTAHDLGTKELLFRLTSLEDPSLSCTAEGEEVTDAIGALITTLYRAKKATFSASNSLISLDLAAAQYGTKKEMIDDKLTSITDWTYEVLDVKEGKVTLTNTPIMVKVGEEETSSVKYIYAVENGQTSTKYTAGTSVSATEFKITGKEIEVPTGVTGKVYVEYQFENTNALRIVNKAANFPEACEVVIYAIFRDKCNENVKYAGKIICPRAKLNPEQVELALTSTGKHAFEFTMMKNYCDDDGDLFTIIVAAE